MAISRVNRDGIKKIRLTFTERSTKALPERMRKNKAFSGLMRRAGNMEVAETIAKDIMSSDTKRKSDFELAKNFIRMKQGNAPVKNASEKVVDMLINQRINLMVKRKKIRPEDAVEVKKAVVNSLKPQKPIVNAEVWKLDKFQRENK